MMEKAHHAFPQKENDDAHVVRVKASGSDKVYLCHPWMASQAQEFINTIKHFGNEFELIVYGDGLLAHLLECGATLEEVDTERELAALPGIQATPA